jgi:predicted phosphohydrolase
MGRSDHGTTIQCSSLSRILFEGAVSRTVYGHLRKVEVQAMEFTLEEE